MVDRAPSDARPTTGSPRSGSGRSAREDGGEGHYPIGRLVPSDSPLARAPTAFPGADPDRARIPADARGRPAFGPVRRFGDYTLIKKLATGGMAEIWMARKTGIAGFQQFLVLKKILAHLAEQGTFVRMFQDEARTSALLSHPNIVQIFDLGRAEGTYFIAMEYIAGENLAAIAWRGMKRGRPLPPSYAASIISSTCKALHYAHTLKGSDGRPLSIVHRDVSPQNILVTYEGEVKVVDFGIAKASTKTEHTKTGMLKGKFSYMSPEQCLGAEIDRRSDIFALGILLYELCTGKRLYKHESELMILDMITKRQVVPPSEVSRDIPPELEQIILRALEKDVNDRFQTAQQMQLALDAFLRGERQGVNNAELSAYMRSLFPDKIEEKRRLRDRASRDDFEALFLQDEPTAATSPALATPFSKGYPSAVRPAASHPAGLPSHAHDFEAPGPHWSARLITGFALVVIVIAGTVLYRHLHRSAGLVQVTRFKPGPTVPAKPARTGDLTVESSPPGASIELDGAAMELADGRKAVTPSDLKGLQYGRTYAIVLKKEGYRPKTLEVEMGESEDGRSHHPTLDPFPGRLITEVQGTGAHLVTVRYDSEPAGSGPRVLREVPGNTTVLVEAEAEGKRCRAKPSRVRVLPNRTALATVTCRPMPRTKAARANEVRGAADGSQRRPGATKVEVGCRPDPDLPPGYVTIDTHPYSRIFWGERELGETPLSKKRLPAGCVELKAVTFDGKARKVKVEVEPNVIRVYRFKI